MCEDRKMDAVEEYFDVRCEDVPADSWEYRMMIRIQMDFENGKQDISYYASMYGL